MSAFINAVKLSVGLVTLPLQALLSIKPVNFLVDRMTGGWVNRDVLARQLFDGLVGWSIGDFITALNDRSARPGRYPPNH